MIDKDLIKKARQANLAKYLLSVGVPLVKCGNRHRHKEHNSLVFTKNAYYWNSQQEHGNSIDYLVRHMDMNFMEAVSALANTQSLEWVQPQVFELDKIELCNNQDKVKRFLYKDRSIGYSVINLLIESKLLFQEVQTNNAVFPMYDENNNCVGAEVQGILKKRFKGIKDGSKYGYGCNVRFSDDNIFDYALFFESAVDLMSFIDYKLNYEKKSLQRCVLISMSGLKLNIVKHSLKAFKGVMTVVLCVDNDNAGKSFKNELAKEIEYIDCPPNEKYKDWNEQLTDTKRNLKPISRLYNHSLTNNQKVVEHLQREAEPQKGK